jgi:hypothetical protein
VRKYLISMIIPLVLVFWGFPTIIELNSGPEPISWLPTAHDRKWSYARLALGLFALVAGVLFLRLAIKQFWASMSD